MAVTGRLALLTALAALVVGALLPSWSGIGLVCAVLLLLVIADLVLAAPVRTLAIERAVPASVRTGEPVVSTLTVTHPGRRRARLLVRDAWPPTTGAGSAGGANRHRVVVPSGERRRVATTLTPTRRGDHHADRVTVRSTGPLGLAARQRGHRVPGTLRALPPFASRRHLPSRLARLRELDGRRAVQVRGQGTEFDSLREYVPGDDVRSIDWRASARSVDMVVRTWRPERDRHVLLVLDTGRGAAVRVGGGSDGLPRLDTVLDAALLLGVLASRGGDRVDLLALDREVRAAVQGAGAGELLPALVTATAPLEARLLETDMRRLAAEVLARAGRRSLVVLFTGLEDPTVAEGLEPVLAPLLRRHTVLVAAVADPVLADLAAGRGDADAVYGAAAAEVTRAERRDVARRLERRGAEVVDAGPDDLAPAVADRYLALKAAGRL